MGSDDEARRSEVTSPASDPIEQTKKKRNKQNKNRADLRGGDGGEEVGDDEVGEEPGEGEQEGVVHRHEQRRRSVPPPLLRRRSRIAGAARLGRLHLLLLRRGRGEIAREMAKGEAGGGESESAGVSRRGEGANWRDERRIAVAGQHVYMYAYLEFRVNTYTMIKIPQTIFYNWLLVYYKTINFIFNLSRNYTFKV